jgi:long-chain fatty acid transport protein
MKFSKQLIACAVAVGLAAPMTAFATNGYFAHGYGVKSKALAGGGSALPQDAMAAADNPAGMVWVGERMDLGLTLFSPSPRKYTVTGAPSQVCSAQGCSFSLEPGTQESDNDFFLIPHFAYNWMLNEKSSVGVSIYGNGGMNTEYPGGSATWFWPASMGGPDAFVTTPGTYGAGKTGVDLSQLFINASYARKFNDKASWGVSLIAAYQRFDAQGLGLFAPYSAYPNNLTNKGYDTSLGFGGKFGIQGEVSKGLTLAASYQTKMSMDEFSEYKGLFAEQGGFDIPATWTVGLAWNIAKTGTLTFDIQGIQYSDIKSIANPLLPNILGTGLGTGLGTDNGAGFGWEDITVYKLGYQWSTSPTWTWRVGASMTEQPIPESETLFNIIAPAVMETHITGGFTYEMGNNNEFSVAAMYAPKSTVKGPNGFDPGQQIELEMTQWELSANWGWKF